MNISLRSTFALGAIGLAAFAVCQDQTYQQFEGKPMPAFSLKSLEGKAVTNQSLKGKVVVFDFWATWCGPCKMASPIMDGLYKKYASKGLVVIGANVSDVPGAAGKYKKEHGYSYPFATGGESLLKHFGFAGIPAFVFVDKKGVVRKITIGYAPSVKDDFEKAIKKLLAA